MGDPKAQLMRGLIEPLLLESMARGPKHGYALIKEVESLFGVAPNKNQIYPLLSRLESEGLISGKADKEGRGKTEFSLTAKGRTLLDDYRSMPPEFMRLVGELWGDGLAERQPAGGPSEGARNPQTMPSPSDHLVVTLRARPGSGAVEITFENLETGAKACASCKAAAEALQSVQKRFFASSGE
ncbi:MAG: PadR family transcriptional regulator [Euryarchaeota archaeon]|nr:PadR family transcriptional regulator [Euryarchaeota archaeon]